MHNYEIETPYFLIDKHELDTLFGELKAALEKRWNNYHIGYSFKTNSLPWLLTYFMECGCYAEVVSDDEYSMANRMGYCQNRIIYNGIIKSKVTFLNAIRNNAIVNIDSQAEIAWLEAMEEKSKASVGIRVNFDIERYCPGQSQEPEEGGRFGFCYENGELRKAIERIQKTGVRLAGLHLHVSSRTRDVGIYTAIANMAVTIAEEYGLSLDYIDIGGGFFGGLKNKPQFDDYIKNVSDILYKCFSPEKTALIVEPGMSLVGSPVKFVVKVLDVKQTTYNRFIVIDGSRINIDPLMTKHSYYKTILRQEENREILDKQVIVGFTCMEHDRLCVETMQQEIKPGDRIVFSKVGAYTMCLSPLFIRYFPKVYVDDGTQTYEVRRRWTADDVIQGSEIVQ